MRNGREKIGNATACIQQQSNYTNSTKKKKKKKKKKKARPPPPPPPSRPNPNANTNATHTKEGYLGNGLVRQVGELEAGDVEQANAL